MTETLQKFKMAFLNRPANWVSLNRQKIMLSLTLFIFVLPAVAMANHDGNIDQIRSGQVTTVESSFTSQKIENSDDQASILQKCLDLPELLPYFPKNSDNSYKKVIVMQYPVSFQPEVVVSKFGEKVVFLGRREISDNNAEAFYMVKALTITDNTATVIFEYSNNTGTPKSIEGTVNLQKAGSGWNVVSSNFNRK